MFAFKKLWDLLAHYLSLHEADAVMDMLYDDSYTSDEIIEYIEWCKKRYEQDESTEFDIWKTLKKI